MATAKDEEDITGMRKKILLAAALCFVLASGCAETPEDAVVKKKNGQSMENYKEAEESRQEKETEGAEENTLAKRLQVPDTYTADNQSGDGTFHLSCDARVEVPDVEQVGIYKVGQLPFDETIITQIIKGLFGDQPMYDGNQYFQTTKAEALAKLEELKKYQAEGNMDPYGYLAAMDASGEAYDPEEVYSLQREIDSWEETYQSAPEEKVREVVSPAISEEGCFSGAVEMDGSVYQYKLKEGAGDHMHIEAIRVADGEIAGSGMWNDSLYGGEVPEEMELPSRQEAEQRAGISKEEAVQQADAYLQNMGLTDFSAKEVNLALKTSATPSINETTSYKEAPAGYLVSYTRDLDGFPVTSEMNYGGNLESMESTQETWAYEKVEILVNQEGLQYVQILNLYQVGEKQVENVEMKPFSEIAKIFEQMIQIQNADMGEDRTVNLQIDRVTLGYMRVYDPGADSASGILVPVWDFFGTETGKTTIEGETMDISVCQPDYSFLTINAVDGTVINKSLGY